MNGNVFNGGTVSPGASIGTLTINGNYTQNANGTLRIEVAGTSPGQFDVLAVNGHASWLARSSSFGWGTSTSVSAIASRS